jgi:hypothetical protein
MAQKVIGNILKMSRDRISSRKYFKIFYRGFMPMLIIVLILGIPSFVERPYLFKAVFFDIMIRIFLTIWFCGIYIGESRFPNASFFPNIKWSKADVGPIEKYFYIGLGILFGVGCALITLWTVQKFLPILSYFSIEIAIFNGLVIILPIVSNYWVFKL